MSSYRIIFTAEARDQIDQLHKYVEAAADADIASGFVTGIIDHIAGLEEFPMQGTTRDDIRPGLRTMGWRRRVMIAFMVEEHDVVVIGIFYGGRDFEALLRDN